MKKGHKYYLDLDVLRILASIAVVLVHVASQKWYTVTDLKTFTVFNFFDCIGRFAVPIFFMISGVLFLDKNRQFDFKTFFS
ncbi:MAG: acyltransferase family protein [Bacilli bacterium]